MTKQSCRPRRRNNLYIAIYLFSLISIGYDNPLSYAQPDNSSKLKVQIEQIPNDKEVDILYNEAKLLYQKNEFKKAKEKFNEVLSIDPSNVGARRYLIATEKKLQADEIRKTLAKEKDEKKGKLSEEKNVKKEANETLLPKNLTSKNFVLVNELMTQSEHYF